LEKSLPIYYYTTPEVFQRERDLIFAQEWLCAGREEQPPSPGNSTVLEVAGESVLVVHRFSSLVLQAQRCQFKI
jgi:phenylpropionate dioxygenase-like ring-hydroxylating dioxygenase large terminal subunit